MSVSRIVAAIRGAASRDAFKYSAVPDVESEREPQQRRQVDRRDSSRRQRLAERAHSASSQGQFRLIKMSLGGMALFAILLTLASLGYAHELRIKDEHE